MLEATGMLVVIAADTLLALDITTEPISIGTSTSSRIEVVEMIFEATLILLVTWKVGYVYEEILALTGI